MNQTYIFPVDIENKYWLIALGIIFFFCSCTNNTKKYYDQSGRLLITEKLINKHDSVFFTKIFNKKGYIEKEGYTDKFQTPHGIWKEFFSDGKLKWKGEIKNNKKCIPDSILFNAFYQPFGIDIDCKAKYLQKGANYKVRTYVEGIPDDAYLVTDSLLNPLSRNLIDPERYPFIFSPKKQGEFFIYIVFPDSNGYVIGNHNNKCHKLGFKVK